MALKQVVSCLVINKEDKYYDSNEGSGIMSSQGVWVLALCACLKWIYKKDSSLNTLPSEYISTHFQAGSMAECIIPFLRIHTSLLAETIN